VTQAEISAVMDTLFVHRAAALPSDALADVFDRLIWCLDDNGAALLRVREDWLQSDELDRVDVALAMDESFPFADLTTMEDVFARISAKWPHLAHRCDSIAAARRANRVALEE
jgi:hypothetical protein